MVLQEPVCKICDSPAIAPLYRFHHATETEPFALLECGTCDFRFIDYMDDPEPAVAETALEETAEAVASGLEFNQGRIAENAELLRSRVGGGRVLDVGCGGGGFLLALGPEYASEGVETDPRLRRYATARGLMVGKQPLEHPVWTARRGEFAAITLWDVIEHVNQPLDLSKRIFELLAPGGFLMIDTPNRDGLFYRVGNILAKLTGGRRGGSMSIQYSSAPFCHKQIFRPCDMRRMLDAAGFRSVEIMEKFELSFPPEHYTRHFIRSAAIRKLLNPLVAMALNLLPIRNKLIVVAAK